MKQTICRKVLILIACATVIIAVLCTCAAPEGALKEEPPAPPMILPDNTDEVSSPVPTIAFSPTPTISLTPTPTLAPTPIPIPYYERYLDEARAATKDKDYEWAIELYNDACASALSDRNCPQDVLFETVLEATEACDKQRLPVAALMILRAAAERTEEQAVLKKEASRIVNKYYEAERQELSAYMETVKSLIKKHGYATKSIGDDGSVADYPLGVFHAELLDMDGDGVMELICFYGKRVSKTRYDYDENNKRYKEKYKEDLPHVVLYTYKNDAVIELLHEAIGYYAGQSDEGKEVYILKDNDNIHWLSFDLDEDNYTNTYYTVQKGNLRSFIMRAYVPEDGIDITESIYDIANKFEINEKQVEKSAFREQQKKLNQLFNRNVYRQIFILLNGEWHAQEYAEYIKTFVQLYSGKKVL